MSISIKKNKTELHSLSTVHSALSTRPRGYTFIELVVVMSIFGIISAVVLFNYSDFSTNISVQNTATDVALELKKTQTDAISGLVNPAAYLDPQFGAYKATYGVHFDTSEPSSFVRFIDLLPNDRVYDPTADCDQINTECLKTLSITTGDRIDKLCIYTGSGSCDEVDELDITFQRPFPDAVIVGDNTLGQSAEIWIKSVKNSERVILVNTLGGISVFTPE